MSDAELSDIADDDDLVRRHEVADEEEDDGAAGSGGEVSANGGDDDAAAADENQDAQPVPVKKKGTRKMMVLNSERLRGPKGVHTIEKLYEGFQFKGKGHEAEDLDGVMKRLEYWAYRMFPKYDFDDFLAKCETLGFKKDLQVHLKKYRTGMITSDDIQPNEIIQEDPEDDEPLPSLMRTESDLRQTAEMREQFNDEAFERLMAQEVAMVEQAHADSQQTQIP
ncbi:unnamed protein product [Trichogramma brassicae]|uniref:TIMELESS-interacting protein n=1 Tax=Trichogramma brassicae TaxID=86971 RepID=A0A6H5IHL8_9HYME|nr:unnamed protein product [Trichogramma brassicae]